MRGCRRLRPISGGGAFEARPDFEEAEMSDQTLVAKRPNSRPPRAWVRRLAIAGTVGTLVAAGVTAAILQPWSNPPPVQAERLSARVELAAGEVQVQTDEGTRRVLSGSPLAEDAKVTTASGARALIRASDGSRVYMDENTSIAIGAGIELVAGRIWIDAPPLERGVEPAEHRVGSISVTLAEGGASLQRMDTGASVYVAEGLAVVTSPSGRSEISAGEQALVEADGSPVVSAVTFWDDWTGGMGDRAGSLGGRSSGSGALYAVDREAPAGSPSLPLSIQRQSVRVVVRDQVAETLVDQSFFNPSSRDVEGYYWFSIPEGSQLVGFALETDGRLVEGELVERKEASAKYETAVERRNDPALLEWIDDRTVRARIFPVPALGNRRIVVRYQQLLGEVEGKLRYTYPLASASGKDAPTIEEFALAVDLGDLVETHGVATLGEARLEEHGRRVTMRRSGYTPRADFQLELVRKREGDRAPVRLSVIDPGSDQARYVMLRYVPDLDFEQVAVPAGEVVVVVDTSAGGDSSEHEARVAVAEALLRSLSEGDRFAVMSADVTAEVLWPPEGLAEATPAEITKAIERLTERSRGGATDLGAIFEQALGRVHGLEQPAVVYVGDGLATSGERGSDALGERLRRSMTGSRARLFTVGVGHEVDGALLDRLARIGGGESLRVESAALAVPRALALAGALKTPTITDLALELGEGLDDVFTSAHGKLTRGDELFVFARTHHDLPREIAVRGRIGGEDFAVTHEVVRDQGLAAQLVPRLWAGAFIDHLLTDSRGPDAARGKILSLGLEYGLMTPYTSFLALDSDQAYAQLGIGRRSRPLGGVRLTADASAARDVAAQPYFEPHRSVGEEILVGILSAPFGCSMGEAPDEAQSAAAPPDDTRPYAVEEKNEVAPDPGAPAPEAVQPESEPAREAEDASGYGRPVQASEADVDEMPARPAAARAAPRPTPSARSESIATGTLGGVVGRGGGGGYRDQRQTRPHRIASPVPREQALPCSDASARGLAHRRILWRKRLARAQDMEAALRVYEASAASCEVPGWRDERTFLQLLQARAATEHDIGLLLGHFSSTPDAASYLSRALLRRLVDPAMVAAVRNAMHDDWIDWADVDRRLALATELDDQVEILQAALARAPGDPAGESRLLDVLVRGGKVSEAIARGRRLRDHGFMTPEVAQALGEVLVASGDATAARRIFSEIVEFAPDDPESRRLLGDIFLRHGWYDGAYRQYEDLRAITEDDALATIRLARAAAGAGRTDEALRILRRIAAGEGRPGPDDPRRFARLHAAAYLARLHAANDGSVPREALERELRRLGLFEGATTWTLVLWEDLSARLVLSGSHVGIAADAIAAADTGLFAVQEPMHASGQATGPKLEVRHAGPASARTVAHHVVTIAFDGKAFTIEVAPGVLESPLVASRAATEEPQAVARAGEAP
jgi:Ca-activated chloride channel homolog